MAPGEPFVAISACRIGALWLVPRPLLSQKLPHRGHLGNSPPLGLEETFSSEFQTGRKQEGTGRSEMVIFHGRGNPSGIPKQCGLWRVLFSEPKGSGKGVLEQFTEEKGKK